MVIFFFDRYRNAGIWPGIAEEISESDVFTPFIKIHNIEVMDCVWRAIDRFDVASIFYFG